MYEQLHAGMQEATRLTRAGRLLEATAAIQRTLQGLRTQNPVSDPIDPPAGEVIEGIFRVVEPAPRPAERAALAPYGAEASPPQHASSPAGQASQRPRTQMEPLTTPPIIGDPPRARKPAEPTAPAIQTVARPGRTSSSMESGGQFLTGSYANAAGARTYKLYIPSGYQGQALPLIVMLHACTQTPDDFAAGTRMNTLAEEQGCFVVYPAQASAANGSKCWNWFKVADQQRDQGEPALIAGITRQICSAYQIDARRIYVAGLSSGGAMAVIMGMTYPDLYAAIGSHSGLAYGVAHDLPSALAAMQRGAAAPDPLHASLSVATPRVVPAIVFHGDRDTTVHPRNADQVIAQCAKHYARSSDSQTETKPRVTVQRGHAPAGQSYTRAVYHDARGQAILEQWQIHGAGHAWSGGSPSGSFTNPNGPDATREMLRFFFAHPR